MLLFPYVKVAATSNASRGKGEGKKKRTRHRDAAGIKTKRSIGHARQDGVRVKQFILALAAVCRSSRSYEASGHRYVPGPNPTDFPALQLSRAFCSRFCHHATHSPSLLFTPMLQPRRGARKKKEVDYSEVTDDDEEEEEVRAYTVCVNASMCFS